MIEKVMIAKNGYFPRVLKFTDIRSYLYAAIFIALSVTVPWLFHQFHLAGPTFLPMHYFVLMAGLVFGWRAGLVVGFFTPLTSYAISGMPVLPILPQIVVELSAYGVVAGILREKFNLRVFWSLLGAMVAGRLALLVYVFVRSYAGVVYSPLGMEENALAVVWATLRLSWPGIVIQLASIPFITTYLEKIKRKYRVQIYS